jgi:hypothetical protein
MAQLLAEAFIIFVFAVTLEKVMWSTCLSINISQVATQRIKLMASLYVMLRSERLKFALFSAAGDSSQQKLHFIGLSC